MIATPSSVAAVARDKICLFIVTSLHRDSPVKPRLSIRHAAHGRRFEPNLREFRAPGKLAPRHFAQSTTPPAAHRKSAAGLNFPSLDILIAQTRKSAIAQFLESVREHHEGLHSFRSMRRM